MILKASLRIAHAYDNAVLTTYGYSNKRKCHCAHIPGTKKTNVNTKISTRGKLKSVHFYRLTTRIK